MDAAAHCFDDPVAPQLDATDDRTHFTVAESMNDATRAIAAHRPQFLRPIRQEEP